MQLDNVVPGKRVRFRTEEYHQRIYKTREAMQRAGLDAIIVSDPSNMAWLTGYDGWSFYVHQCVVLTHYGDPIWYGRGQDASGAKRTVYMESDDLIVGYPDDYVQNTLKHPMDLLAGYLHDWGLGRAYIGVEMDNYWFSAKAMERLHLGCPGAQFLDATALVNWQRAIKSDQEIIYMKRAGEFVAKAHQMVYEQVIPGVRKNDLVADIFHQLISGTEEYGGDYPAIVPLLPSGVDASAPHLTWDDQPFYKDEVTFFELSGCYQRYHCPTSRTIYLGEPPAELRRAETAVLACIEAALDQAKPGNTLEMVANAAQAALNKHGFEKDSRFGYPIGLSYPPDWGERTYSIRQGDYTELHAGMTFHFIPALWQDSWGLEITESVLITEDGCETLAPMPDRELWVKSA